MKTPLNSNNKTGRRSSTHAVWPPAGSTYNSCTLKEKMISLKQLDPVLIINKNFEIFKTFPCFQKHVSGLFQDAKEDLVEMKNGLEELN